LEADPLERLWTWYASHSDAGLDVVSSLQGVGDRVYEALRGIADGVVVLATCNRFEVYVDTAEPEAVRRVLTSILGGLASKLSEARGVEAAWRLARIAAGLESAVLGEHEILGQVREAWLRARDRGATTRLLDMVFHAALRAGRRARLETGISEGSLGYPSAAVRMAAENLGGLEGARILVVGTGQAAKSMLRIICSGQYGGPAAIVVAGRSRESATRVIRESCKGQPATLDEARRLAPFDVALVAVAGAPDLSWLADAARLVIDISLPRATPRAANVVGLEEVTAYARSMEGARRREIPKVERIIAEELEKLEAKLREIRAEPLIAMITRYAASLSRVEAERTARRLGLTDGGVGYLEKAFESYARKLLHPLMEALRETARRGEAALLTRLLAEAYSSRLEGGKHGGMGLLSKVEAEED
jgi:glutamyl-tRNA reductase